MFNFDNSLWVWGNDTETVNNYMQFKKIINISDNNTVNEATIYLTADTNYSLFINGVFVDCGLYQYGQNKFSVDIINITKYLEQGDNVICVVVHYQGVLSSQYSKKRAGLIYKICIDDTVYYSDNSTYVREDPCYLRGTYTKVSRQLGFNFLYDATNEDDWLTSKTIDKSFSSASCIAIGNEMFVERPIAKCDLLPKKVGTLVNCGVYKRDKSDDNDIAKMLQDDFLKTLNPTNIFDDKENLMFDSSADGIFLVYDLMREEAGLLSIGITTQSPLVVDIAYGEHLCDLRVRAKIHDRNFANRYICKEGSQNFTHYQSRIAGRYLQLHIPNSETAVKIDHVSVVPMEYPIKGQNNLYTNDALYNNIYEVCKRTLHICMHEHYEDTPWREQALYAMDSRNQALFGYYCFGEFDFARESLSLLGESIKPDNYLRITSPTDSNFCIPSFSLIWITSIYEHMLFSGDIEFANRHITQCEAMIDAYLARTNNGIPCPPFGEDYWNFYDWADGLAGEVKENSQDSLYLLFLLLAMQSHDKMVPYCNNSKRLYTDNIAEIKKAVNEIFWDKDKQLYSTYKTENSNHHYCVLTQALAIITKACPDASESELRVRMTEDNTLVKTTFSLTIFFIESLLGEREKYLDYVLDMVETQWGNMLYQGATSFWETEKGEQDFGGAGSLSHAWSTLPVYVFAAFVQGLHPTSPGFKTFECKPIGEKILSSKMISLQNEITVNKNGLEYIINSCNS